MAEWLISVGLDVGTTTTQLIVSRLGIENQASAFAVPELRITNREILYESPVCFTPQLSGNLIDGARLREWVEAEYQKANISRGQVDTGAVIITGETSRKENARTVLTQLSDIAGDFVVATAGPDLESVLAAKGAGAVEYSRRTGETVLHMDIGGGTSNLSWIRDGEIIHTGCLNVGGRLLRLDGEGRIVYVSPVLEGLTELGLGDKPREGQLSAVADMLARGLEMAAGLRTADPLLDKLVTAEANPLPELRQCQTISFSGGVADCIETVRSPLTFGDVGPILGQAIRRSRLCQGRYILGEQTIRATVIGAGCHSTQLSGSTVYHRNVTFPLKGLEVLEVGEALLDEPEKLKGMLSGRDSVPVLALSQPPGDYEGVKRLADRLVQGIPDGAVYLALAQDAGKALGQALALRLPPSCPVLCLDGLRLSLGSYLDVAAPVGPAFPVVIKTLVFSH